MTPQNDSLGRSLKQARWSVLGLLVCCLGLILLRGFENPEPPPDRWLTTVAVLLALGTIVLGRFAASPGVDVRRAIWLMLAALVVAAALGLFGVYVAWADGDSMTGLLFSLAGIIFAIRPTRPLGSARGRK